MRLILLNICVLIYGFGQTPIYRAFVLSHSWVFTEASIFIDSDLIDQAGNLYLIFLIILLQFFKRLNCQFISWPFQKLVILCDRAFSWRIHGWLMFGYMHEISLYCIRKKMEITWKFCASQNHDLSGKRISVRNANTV